MRGFSTIEIMIAVSVIVLAVSASALVSGSTLGSTMGSDDHTRALAVAKALIENERSLARDDFDLVESTTSMSNDFTRSIAVTPPSIDPYDGAVRIEAHTTWQDAYDRTQDVSLTTLLSRTVGTASNDGCGPISGSGWQHPRMSSYAMLAGMLLPASAPIGHTFSATNPISALEPHRGILFAGLASTSVKTNDSFFVFDISDTSQPPQYKASFDPNLSSIDGISAITTAGNYAFAGSAHDANFKSCKPGPNCAQLLVIDISNPTNPTLALSFLLPTSTLPYVLGNMTSSGQAIGKSLFYDNGYLFLGLSKTASGPEFNILDMHDPLNPKWVGSFGVGASINQIVVKHGYAYLATDDRLRELIVLDVHDPLHPALTATFDPKGTLGYEIGESVAPIGESIIIGMSYAKGSPELYAIDQSMMPALSVHASTTISSSAIAMIAHGSKLFSITTTKRDFEIFDTSRLSLITNISLPGAGAALACEGMTLFAASNATGIGNISVVAPDI